MNQSDELEAVCAQLARRLEGSRDASDLRAIYLELFPIVAQLRGLVHESVTSFDNVATETVQQQLAGTEAIARRVALDMRLASPAALKLGLQTALVHVQRTMELLRG